MDRLHLFDVEDADIMRIVLDFLYRRQSFEALSGLLLECNLPLPFLVPEHAHFSPSLYDAPWLLYLQKLVLQGRWDDLDGYLKSIIASFKTAEEILIANKIQVEILRQKFLEVLSWQGGGGQKIAFPPWQWQLLQTSKAATEKPNAVLEMLLSYLNELQTLCSEEDFGALCQCLTLDRLDEHPFFADWTVSQGRIACFREIRSALLGRSESWPSLWTVAGSETGLEAMASLALQQLLHRREKSDAVTLTDPQQPTKVEFNLRSRCLVPLPHTNIAPDHAIGVQGANINVLNKISCYRRFDQKSPFEKPASIPVRIPSVTQQNAQAQSHVFEFIAHRDGHSESGDESKAGVAETKRENDDGYVGEPSQVLKLAVAPTISDNQEPPQQGVLKTPRRPPPIPVTATTAGNAVPEISNAEAKESESHSHFGNELPARGGESLAEKAKDSSREAVAFFVDVGPPAGKPRNTNSRFAAAAAVGKERGNKDSKEVQQQQPAVEVESSEQRDKSKASKHVANMDTVHKNDSIPFTLPHKKPNVVAEESFINSPQPRIRESPLLPSNHPLGQQQRSEDGRSDAVKPQTKVQQIPDKLTTFSPTVLFRTDCPLRCVCLLSSQQETESGARNYAFAVGSNSKCVQTFSVSEARLLATLPVQESLVRSAVDAVVREKEFLNIHKGSVYALDWLGSHQLLVSGSNDKCLKICNVQSGLVSGNYKGHNGTIRVVKFNDWVGIGAAEIASAGAGDCKPRIWDINESKNVATLSAHPDAVHGLFWKDRSTVVTGCDSGLLCAHDVRNPHTQPAWSHQLQRGSEVPSVCCLAPLGQDLIVVGCSTGWLQIIDTRNGRSVVEQRLHLDDIRSLSILPLAKGKGWGLLTSSYDSTAALWSLDSSLCSSRSENAASDKACEKVFALSRGHSDKVLCAAFAVGAGAEVDWARPPPILSSGADGVVLLWQATRTTQGRAV